VERECDCDGVIPLCTHLIYYGAATYVHPRREVPHCDLIDSNPPSRAYAAVIGRLILRTLLYSSVLLDVTRLMVLRQFEISLKIRVRTNHLRQTFTSPKLSLLKKKCSVRPFAFFHPLLDSVDDTTEPYNNGIYQLHHCEEKEHPISIYLRTHGVMAMAFRVTSSSFCFWSSPPLRVQRFLGYFARKKSLR